jgi:hypothetical protein
MLSHEASIIATKERRNENDRVFHTKKIVVDGAGHSITKRREPQSVQNAAMTVGRS